MFSSWFMILHFLEKEVAKTVQKLLFLFRFVEIGSATRCILRSFAWIVFGWIYIGGSSVDNWVRFTARR